MTDLIRQLKARPSPVQDTRAAETGAAEAGRLQALRDHRILDTPPDGSFDRITRLTAELFNVPIAIVTLVDEDRIWFKSRVGIAAVTEIPRDPGLCASAILDSQVYVVENARSDPRTLANSLVASDLGFQFCAAAPLVTADQHRLGTLCIIDTQPRTLSESEKALLETLAGVVMDEMELRLAARRVVGTEREQRHQSDEHRKSAEIVASALQGFLLPHRLPELPGIDLAATYRPANAEVVGGDFYDVFQAPDRSWFLAMGDVCGKGPEAAAATAAARYALRAAAMHERDPAAILALVNETMLSGAEEEDTSRWCTLALTRLERTTAGFTFHVASGGHPLPHLVRAAGSGAAVGGAGTIVGAIADGRWTTTSIELRSGDAIVFFTDGVTEARIGARFFGRDRLEAVLESSRHLGPGQVIENVLAQMSTLGAVRRDDIALLIARVR